MQIQVSMGTEGISIAATKSDARLEPSPSASQTAPRRFYVYGHYDAAGVPFYIGKGTERRAWSDDRHPLWHRYVNNHLHGVYAVRILEDNLSSDEAEEVESGWVAQEAETLVNWINFGRNTDFDALERYHQLRKGVLELVSQARALEETDTDAAIRLYREALRGVDVYSRIQPEQGLVGRLIDEELIDGGLHGELVVLDRITLCLCKQRQGGVAKQVSDSYFESFRADTASDKAEQIRKRVLKAARRDG